MVSIPAAISGMSGKTVGELIGKDVKVLEDGTVTGTLKHVSGFTWFNPSDVGEQTGNYFPFKLGEKYTGKEVTVQRNGGTEKTANDKEWVVRVPSNDTVYTVKAEDVDDLKLNFSKATLKTE